MTDHRQLKNYYTYIKKLTLTDLRGIKSLSEKSNLQVRSYNY